MYRMTAPGLLKKKIFKTVEDIIEDVYEDDFDEISSDSEYESDFEDLSGDEDETRPVPDVGNCPRNPNEKLEVGLSSDEESSIEEIIHSRYVKASNWSLIIPVQNFLPKNKSIQLKFRIIHYVV